MMHGSSDTESPDALKYNLKAASPNPATPIPKPDEYRKNESKLSKSARRCPREQQRKPREGAAKPKVKEDGNAGDKDAAESAFTGIKVKLEPSSDGTVDGSS